MPRLGMAGHVHYADSLSTPMSLSSNGKFSFSLLQCTGTTNSVTVSVYCSVDPRALKRLVVQRAVDVSRQVEAHGRPRMFSNRIAPSANNSEDGGVDGGGRGGGTGNNAADNGTRRRSNTSGNGSVDGGRRGGSFDGDPVKPAPASSSSEMTSLLGRGHAGEAAARRRGASGNGSGGSDSDEPAFQLFRANDYAAVSVGEVLTNDDESDDGIGARAVSITLPSHCIDAIRRYVKEQVGSSVCKEVKSCD